MKKQSYTNGDWTGELFGHGGVIILKGQDVKLLKMKGCTATVEQLAEFVDKCKEVDERRGANNAVQ